MLEVNMASLRHERRVAASPDELWRVVTRLDSLPEWFPGVVSCVVDGHHRTVTLATGIEMPEEILVNDPLRRRFVYRITSPLYRCHLGVIDLIEVGERDTLCVYSTTAEPDVLALLVAGASVGALEGLARLVEKR